MYNGVLEVKCLCERGGFGSVCRKVGGGYKDEWVLGEGN